MAELCTAWKHVASPACWSTCAQGPPSGSGTTANEAAGGLLLNAGLVLAGVGLTTSVGGGAYRHWQANRASETTAKGGSGSVTMELNALIDFCAAVFQSFGVKSAVAARLGRDIAQAEAWRQSTHGLDQLFSNVERLESGVFSAAAEPTVVTPSAGGTAVIDGHRCLGPGYEGWCIASGAPGPVPARRIE